MRARTTRAETSWPTRLQASSSLIARRLCKDRLRRSRLALTGQARQKLEWLSPVAALVEAAFAAALVARTLAVRTWQRVVNLNYLAGDAGAAVEVAGAAALRSTVAAWAVLQRRGRRPSAGSEGVRAALAEAAAVAVRDARSNARTHPSAGSLERAAALFHAA